MAVPEYPARQQARSHARTALVVDLDHIGVIHIPGPQAQADRVGSG
jgi:hypothetical protein